MDRTGAIFWFLGKLAITTNVFLLVGALIFWIFSERKGVLFEVREWSQRARYFLTITYFYLVSSYCLTILSIAYVFQSPRLLELMATNPITVIISSLIGMTVLTAMLEFIPYTQKETLLKNGLWTLHSVLMAPAFAYFGTYICVESIIEVAAAIILASLMSFSAPKRTYIDIKPHLEVLYIIVTVTSFLCFLFNPPVNTVGIILLTCNLCAGIMLYFGVFITNTQYMLSKIHENNYDPVYTAAVMYLSTLNLLLRVAMFHVIDLTDLTFNEVCYKQTPDSNHRNFPEFGPFVSF